MKLSKDAIRATVASACDAANLYGPQDRHWFPSRDARGGIWYRARQMKLKRPDMSIDRICREVMRRG